ncbi:hypothetical protein BC830DRAFT_1167939 [Chytriomyces sp. MP71]|nr:hypothetical protein BC830DRAFT_1167939 [Chytriomyces sp. MP71]
MAVYTTGSIVALASTFPDTCAYSDLGFVATWQLNWLLAATDAAGLLKQTLEAECAKNRIRFETLTDGFGATSVEGEWEDVMAVVAGCRDALLRAGFGGVSFELNLQTRTDVQQTLDEELAEIEAEYRKLQQ